MEQVEICVLGGTGFIGSEVCRLAVSMGHRVTSVSRRGAPDVDQPWVAGVRWIAADILDADRWAGQLADCQALVHSVGIVAEGPDQRQTFERLHRQSTTVASRAAVAAGVAKFVYVSAAKTPPAVDQEYLQSKLDAEATLQRSGLSVAILRPVVVAGQSPADGPCGAFAAACAREPTLDRWMGTTVGLALPKVAIAALRAALQPDTTGVLEVDAIDHLGDAMFIQ